MHLAGKIPTFVTMRKVMIRQTRRTVTFSHPFTLNREEGERAAGAYVVETEEEKVNTFSSPFSTAARL